MSFLTQLKGNKHVENSHRINVTEMSVSSLIDRHNITHMAYCPEIVAEERGAETGNAVSAIKSYPNTNWSYHPAPFYTNITWQTWLRACWKLLRAVWHGLSFVILVAWTT